MIDTKLLSDVIDKSGLKKYRIAEELGLSSYGLQKKINGETEFKASEIKKLSILLHLSMEVKEKIFFADKVN
mgnify:CR=1 FL=1